MFLEFAGPLLKMFLRTNASKARRLDIRDQEFAKVWVAGVHSEVLVCVGGLDVQVRTYLAIFQVDHHIVESSFFCRPRSCEFDGQMVMVDVFNEDS